MSDDELHPRLICEWSEEDQAYIATHSAFPGLSGVNADMTAALEELLEALEMALSINVEDSAAAAPPETR